MFEQFKSWLSSVGLGENSAMFQLLWGAKVRLLNPILHARIGRRARKCWSNGSWPNARDPEVMNGFLNAVGLPKIPCPFDIVGSGTIDPCLLVVSICLYDQDVRSQFSKPITGGGQGPFARWLASNGAERYGLSSPTMESMISLLNQSPGDIARRFIDVNEWFLERVPLAFHSGCLPVTMQFLLKTGHKDMGVVDVSSIAWMAMECSEEPVAELLATWKRLPAWQCRWPEALAKPFMFLAGLARDYPGLSSVPGWHEPVIEQPNPYRCDLGINIISYWNCPCGLREASRQMSDAALGAGLSVSRRDMPNTMRHVLPDRAVTLGMEVHDLTVTVIPPHIPLPDLMRRAGLFARPGVKRVGVWYWELENVPSSWRKLSRSFDEIWAPSQFIASAMEKVLDCPVVAMPAGVAVPEFNPQSRGYFGLSSDETVFLFTCDAASSLLRKNPFDLVKAFVQAFEPTDAARLVIKISRPEAEPEEMERLRALIPADARITLIESTMTRNDVLALIETCDAYISMHRAEGFGLGMAEAALLGKPVIATAYSGSLDFLSPEWSLPVEYTLQPIGVRRAPFQPSWKWASPDIEMAARHMRWVYQCPAEARALGEKARTAVGRVLDPVAYGQRLSAAVFRLKSSDSRNVSAA